MLWLVGSAKGNNSFMLQVLLMMFLHMERRNRNLKVGYKFDKRSMESSTAIKHSGSIKFINGSHACMIFLLLFLHNC
jgi:hypothetical protein